MNLRTLESKYMDIIWDWFSGEKFLEDLIRTESYIKKNYKDLELRWQIKNKLQHAAERLIMFYAYSNMKIIATYPSPLSSDLAFYTEDALINIDAKTIDLVGNANDDNWIQFNGNQISFKNKPLHTQTLPSGQIFSGVRLFPGLPDIGENGKPCLTYFASICYKDDGKSFSLSHIRLHCVPNSEIANSDFNNDLIQNYKTYRYLGKDEAKGFGDAYMPKPKGYAIPSTWIPFALKTKGRIDTWMDTNLKHPFNRDECACWRVMDDGKYMILLEGGTARIDPKKIKDRKDDAGRMWGGARYKEINQNQSLLRLS